MLDEGFLSGGGVEGDNPAPRYRPQATYPTLQGVRLICPYRQSERGIRGGWEEAGTLAPRAATVLWELACKFPEFPHINFRTVLETRGGWGTARRQGGQLSEKGQREGEAVWPGLPLPASPGP